MNRATYSPDQFPDQLALLNTAFIPESNVANTVLSKTQFIRGLQCHKSLWLYRNRPELRSAPDAATQARFDAGREVGIVAQQLFPDGTLIEFDRSAFQEKIRATKAAMEKGARTIYEATFSHDGVLVMVDILHKGTRGWEICEVKSTTEVKEHHIPDAAVQYAVLRGSGLRVSKASIVHVNNEYVREGKLEVKDLFPIEDVTAQVRDLQDFVGEQLLKQRRMLDRGMPDIDIGPQCDDPYACDFKAECWKHVPVDSVFDLRERGVDKFSLYRKGIIRLKDIPLDILNAKQRFQVESTLQKRNYLNKGKIAEFLGSLWHPLCFLDFETFGTAIPMYDGTWPYQQVPFQYSIHVQKRQGGGLQHYEYLAKPGTDPREELLEGLLAAIPDNACVVAYNAAFEARVLKDLADRYSRHRARISRITGNFVDLMQPFRNRHIYCWQVRGSYSLKQVLPALVPKMNYQGMEISDGAMAGQAYLDMGRMEDPKELQRIRKALLEYCKKDTLGMVEILKKVRSLAGTS